MPLVSANLSAFEPFLRLVQAHGNLRRNQEVGNSYEELLRLEEMMGSVSKGMKEEDLKTVDSIKFSNINSENCTNCTVCITDFEKDDDVVVFNVCKHVYHKECILNWLKLNKTCPICRSEFN